MLTRADRGFLFWLIAAYLAFAEILSWAPSISPCVVISQYQPADDNSGNESYATMHEAIIRFIRFIYENSTHDNVLAFGTLLIAAFTWTLWRSTEKMWGITNESVRLARSDYLSSHRPRMRLKHIWLTSDTDWRLGRPLEVNLDIVNVGNTPGLITFVNYDTVLLPSGSRLPQRPPYDETPFGPGIQYSRFPTNFEVRPGLTAARQVSDGRTFTDAEIHAVLWNESELYFIGTIEFWDAAGLRQTGFCRKLTFNAYPPANGDWGRLEIYDDKDYEFEEWS